MGPHHGAYREVFGAQLVGPRWLTKCGENSPDVVAACLVTVRHCEPLIDVGVSG
jgi:hypothetical protein